MTTSRILCPLDCGWHHDQEDPTLSPAAVGLPLPTPDLAYILGLERLHAVEGILRAHLETHELLEWVTALTTAQRRIAELERQPAAQPEPVRLCLGLNRIGPDEDVCGKPSCRCRQVAAVMKAALESLLAGTPQHQGVAGDDAAGPVPR